MKSQNPTSSQRALAVLDCFTSELPSLTLPKIARLLDQSLSSTNRRELTGWGSQLFGGM